MPKILAKCRKTFLGFRTNCKGFPLADYEVIHAGVVSQSVIKSCLHRTELCFQVGGIVQVFQAIIQATKVCASGTKGRVSLH